MARTFNYSINNISGGLSNKPDLLKDYSEVKDMNNMMISQYKGLKRRNPTTAELSKLDIKTIRTDPNYKRLLRVPNTNKDIVKVYKEGDKTLLFCIYDNRDIIDDLEPINIGISGLSSEGITFYNQGLIGDFDETVKYHRFEPVIIDFDTGDVLFTMRDKAIDEVDINSDPARNIIQRLDVVDTFNNGNSDTLEDAQRYNIMTNLIGNGYYLNSSVFIENMYNMGLEILNTFDYDINGVECRDIFSVNKKGKDFYVLNKYKNIDYYYDSSEINSNITEYVNDNADIDDFIAANTMFINLPQDEVNYNVKYKVKLLFNLPDFNGSAPIPDETINGYDYFLVRDDWKQNYNGQAEFTIEAEYNTPSADFDDGVNTAADFTTNTYVMEQVYNDLLTEFQTIGADSFYDLVLEESCIKVIPKKNTVILTPQPETGDPRYIYSPSYVNQTGTNNILYFERKSYVSNLSNSRFQSINDAILIQNINQQGVRDISSIPDNLIPDNLFVKVYGLSETKSDDYYLYKSKRENVFIENVAKPYFVMVRNNDYLIDSNSNYNITEYKEYTILKVIKDNDKKPNGGYQLPIFCLRFSYDENNNNYNSIYNEFGYETKYNIEPLVNAGYFVGDYKQNTLYNDFLSEYKKPEKINDFEFKNGSLILYYGRQTAFSQNRNINNFYPLSLRTNVAGEPLFLEYLSNSNNEFKKVVSFKNNSLIFCDNEEQVLLSFQNNIISPQTIRYSDFNNYNVSNDIEPFISNNSLIFVEKDNEGKDYIYEIYENYNGILKTRLLNRKIQGIDFSINKIMFYKNKLILQNKDNLNEFLVNKYGFNNEDKKTYDLWERYTINGFSNIINVEDNIYDIDNFTASKMYLDELNLDNDYIYYIDNYIDLKDHNFNITVRKDFENFDETNTGNIPDYNTFTGKTRMYFKYTSDGSSADNVEKYIRNNFINNGYVIINNKRYEVTGQGNYERLGGEKGYYLIIDHLFDEIKNQNYQDTNITGFGYDSLILGKDYTSSVDLNTFYITDRYTKQKITYGRTVIVDLNIIFNNTNSFKVLIDKTKRNRTSEKIYKYTDTTNSYIDNTTYDNFDNSLFNVKIKSETEDYEARLENNECSAFCINALDYKIKFHNKK